MISGKLIVNVKNVSLLNWNDGILNQNVATVTISKAINKVAGEA